MVVAANTMVAITALMHFMFMILEMFLWTKPEGLRIFRMRLEHAQATRVIAANQGLYNGFLAAGLVWSLVAPYPEFAFQLRLFFLVCVIVAAIYGAWSVKPRVLVVQGGPAILALVFTLMAF